MPTLRPRTCLASRPSPLSFRHLPRPRPGAPAGSRPEASRSVEPAVLHELAGLGDHQAEQEEGEAEAHGDARHHLVAKAAAAEATTAVAIAAKGMTKQRL